MNLSFPFPHPFWWLPLFIFCLTLLGACSSKKLTSIYEPEYVEKLENQGSELILPPGLSLGAGDKFDVPEKVKEELEEYQNIFSIFSDSKNFGFRTDNQGRYWLEARSRSDRIWLGIKEFFRSEGLEFDYEKFSIGELRTQWAENLARNKVYGEDIRYADRYLLQLAPASEGVLHIHLRHQGMVKSIDDNRNDPKKRSAATEGEGGAEQSDKKPRLDWHPRPSEPALALEMLTRMAIFLGSPEDKTRRLRREQVTGVMAKVYLERSQFGDISLAVGDNLPRTYNFLVQALEKLEQFDDVDDEDQPKKISFAIHDYQQLDPALPENLTLQFVRRGEFIKIFLFDSQDNIINPVYAEGVFRLVVGELRPTFQELDLDDEELELEKIDTRRLPPNKISK